MSTPGGIRYTAEQTLCQLMNARIRSFVVAAKAAMSSPAWWRRRALSLVLGYLLAMVAVYFAQRSLMYPSTPMSRAQFERAVSAVEGASVLRPFDAIVIEPDASRPTVATAIWFHGNGGLGGHRVSVADQFRARGIRLVLAEYPGYGPREGERTEASFVADGKALYAQVRDRYPGQLIVIGESLGTAVASAVAAEGRPDRVVLLTPLRNMPEAAARLLWMYPTRWLVKDRLDTEAHLARYPGPVSILVAGRDEVVGPEAGLALACERGLTTGRGLVMLERSTHNGWATYLDRKQWDELLGVPLLLGSASR